MSKTLSYLMEVPNALANLPTKVFPVINAVL